MKTYRIGLSALALLGLLAAPALALKAPSGPAVDRNLDLAAEKAFASWVAELEKAPHIEAVKNIGVLKLAGDTSDFTTLLADQLTQVGRFKVVILSGPEWDALETEVARQDPDAGLGDMMDKASIIWKSSRGSYQLPEAIQGADALLIGSVRNLDGDWLRARAIFSLHLGTVGERTRISGGRAEGESVMGWKDIAVIYKTQILLGIVGLIALIILLGFLKSFITSMTRAR